MANATPSQSIKLGANLQEQLGDLKGAAKSLKEEAKSAQAEARTAQRELKALERRQAKGEKVDTTAAVKRVQDKEFEAEQKKQRAKDLIQRDKDNKKLITGVDKRLNSFERAATGQMFSVKDSLDLVSRKLTQTQSGIAQSFGKSIGAISSKITPGMISSIAKVAGPVGAAYMGAEIGSKFVDVQHRFRDRGKQVAEIQGASAENMRKVVQGFVTQDLPKDFVRNFNQIKDKAAIGAAQDIAKQDLLGFFDPGQILKNLGMEGSTEKELRNEKRKSERIQEQLDLLGVGAQYGQKFAEKITVDTMKNSIEVKKAWDDYIKEDASKIIASKLLSVGGLTDWADVILGREDFVQALSEGRGKRTTASEAIKRAEAKERAQQNPEDVSERHIRSSRRAGLERQRLRREMQWNKF